MSDKPVVSDEIIGERLARLQRQLDNGEGWSRDDCEWILSTVRELRTDVYNMWISVR